VDIAGIVLHKNVIWINISNDRSTTLIYHLVSVSKYKVVINDSIVILYI